MSSDKRKLIKRLEDLHRTGVLSESAEECIRIASLLYEAARQEALPVTKKRYIERIDRIRCDSLMKNEEVAMMVIRLLYVTCEKTSELTKTVERINQIRIESSVKSDEVAEILVSLCQCDLDKEKNFSVQLAETVPLLLEDALLRKPVDGKVSKLVMSLDAVKERFWRD
jgi:hypothetical protein